MLQPNSRITMENGIKFYEQDILYDDYIYSGDFDIALTIEYSSPGFALGLTNSEGRSLSDKEQILLFKIGQKDLDIIFSNKDSQKTLATYNCAFAKTYTENLKYILQKRDSNFTLYIGSQKVCTFKAPVDFDTYNLIYYSNKDNTIKNINIASSIPYGWVTNMQNTNGGYIIFYRDSFEFKHCLGEAEIEQPDIYLTYGKYYLKYEVEGDSDIIPYVFQSEDERIQDNKKNILSFDNSFTLDYSQKISLKFEGTKGKIKNICITTDKNNLYYRTSPDKGDRIDIKGSKIFLDLAKINSFNFKFKISHVPGSDHTNPLDYSIISYRGTNYGLFDLDLAQDIVYLMHYENNTISISKNDYQIKTINLSTEKSSLTLFNNVNAVITDFVLIDNNNKETNVIVQNTIKKYVPATIYSPIIVVDENEQPLELSSSFRIFNKNGADHYWFTNVEREWFKPAHLIKLTNQPSMKDNSIIVYGIRKESDTNFDNILRIEKEGKDTIDAFANYYDILFEKDLRYINKAYKEIRLTNINDYKYIVVDYLKEDSYAINYRHEYNSYEVDISIEEGKKNKLIYNNADEVEDGITYINEYRYVDTKTIPSEDCYIVIGR